MADPNDILIREVDDDLRRARMEALWRQYRKPLLLAVVALVMVTAGHQVWESKRQKEAGVAMARLDTAIVTLQQGKAAEAAPLFAQLADDSSGSLHDVARWWHARALTADGQNEKAAAQLNDLAEHPKGSDLLWRDLACLKLMGQTTAVPKACTQDLASPLVNTRREWTAAQYVAEGKTKEAVALVEKVANDEAAARPQRARAAQLAASLNAEGK